MILWVYEPIYTFPKLILGFDAFVRKNSNLFCYSKSPNDSFLSNFRLLERPASSQRLRQIHESIRGCASQTWIMIEVLESKS